jgi:hypothetical protein
MDHRERPDMPSELPRSHEHHTDQPEKKDKRKNLFIGVRFSLSAFAEDKTV